MKNPGKWEWWLPSEGGVVEEEGHLGIISVAEKTYCPFDYPSLPNIFAKVVDKKTGIKFIEKYGLLGYYDGLERYAKGDPIDWLLSQAANVRFSLNLISLIKTKDTNKIIKTVELHSKLKPLNLFDYFVSDDHLIVSDDHYGLGPAMKEWIDHPIYKAIALDDHLIPTLVLPVKDKEILLLLNIKEWIEYPIFKAMGLVKMLVEKNSASVGRSIYLRIDKSDKRLNKLDAIIPVATYTSDSLIEAIWHQVGDSLLLVYDNQGKGIKNCEECGLPFIVTDERQRFCPPDPFSKESNCGVKNRVRRNRKEKKRKELIDHGKTTNNQY